MNPPVKESLTTRWPSLSEDEKAAAVATKVMGWKLCQCGDADCGLHDTPTGFLPGFSTSCNAAMLVVEEMRKRGYWVQITNSIRGHWFVVFVGVGNRQVAETEATSLPDAICLAALRAAESDL